MKVVCNKISLSTEQNLALGYSGDNLTAYELTVGKHYTVLGLSYNSLPQDKKGTLLLIRDDIDRCAFVPICLLGISDPRPSIYWEAEKIGDYGFRFWPKEFFANYFHDDLSDGKPDVVEVFDQVCEKLDQEEHHNLI